MAVFLSQLALKLTAWPKRLQSYSKEKKTGFTLQKILQLSSSGLKLFIFGQKIQGIGLQPENLDIISWRWTSDSTSLCDKHKGQFISAYNVWCPGGRRQWCPLQILTWRLPPLIFMIYARYLEGKKLTDFPESKNSRQLLKISYLAKDDVEIKLVGYV